MEWVSGVFLIVDLPNQYAFPVLLLDWDSKSVPLNSIEKGNLYSFCIQYIFADSVKSPFGIQWKEHLPTSTPLVPAWRGLYTPPNF